MSKSIKFKNNIYLDSKSVVHNKLSLNEILTPDLLYDGYIKPASGIINIGSVAKYKRLVLCLEANGSHTTVTLLPYQYGNYVGVNWQAMDNRLATYYVTFKITTTGEVSILHSGYILSSSTSDYIREYGISKIYGYKF